MKGILVVAVVFLIAEFTDAQITGWAGTGLTLVGANGKVATLTKDAKVAEGSAAGTEILALTASPTASGAAVTYTITTNPGNVGVVATNKVNVAVGKTLDYETGSSIVFVVIAVETGKTAADETGTATITVNIKNKLEFSSPKIGLCANDGLTAGSVISTFAVSDAQTGETVAYTLGTAIGDLEYVSATGVLKVAASKTLSMATTNSYTLSLVATGTLAAGASDAGAADVVIAVCAPSGAAKVSAVVGAILLSIVASVFI